VLAPFYSEIRSLYVEEGFARVSKTRLLVNKDLPGMLRAAGVPVPAPERLRAVCRNDGTQISAAPILADEPVSRVVAILAHELGHAVDFSYPGRFLWLEGALVETNAWEADPEERAVYNTLQQWHQRPDHAVERTADALAELVTGREVWYTGPLQLQDLEAVPEAGFAPQRPRPEALDA